MGALAVDGRYFAGWNEAAAEQELFVFAVKDDDLHGQVLAATKEGGDLRKFRAFFAGKFLPALAMTAQRVEGLGEARQKSFAALVKFKKRFAISLAKGLPHGLLVIQRRATAADGAWQCLPGWGRVGAHRRRRWDLNPR